MNVIRHDHEFVQQISGGTIVIKGVNQRLRPALVTKEATAPPCGGRDHVGLRIISCVLSLWLHFPQRLKPGIFLPLAARLEAVPSQSLPSSIIFTKSLNR